MEKRENRVGHWALQVCNWIPKFAMLSKLFRARSGDA